MLSALGGGLGLLAATWGSRVLESSLPPALLPVPDLGVDATVVAFAVGVTLLTGVVFGLAPAWQATRVNLATTLTTAGRSSVEPAYRPFLRQGLACAELALATVLLVGAVLLSRSLLELQRVPLGFNPQGVTSFQVAVPVLRYDLARRASFHRELSAGLRGHPRCARRRRLQRHPVRGRQLHDVAGRGARFAPPPGRGLRADRLADRRPWPVRDPARPAAPGGATSPTATPDPPAT